MDSMIIILSLVMLFLLVAMLYQTEKILIVKLLEYHKLDYMILDIPVHHY